ncbi:MAG: hypothetical protein LC099_05370 [Anaerolineales bacterium]|nr:hypothetical protein [Anaerolineales bacterium]
MDNLDFLKIAAKSFVKYLMTGARSNEKLKILHGALADDLYKRLGKPYSISALGYGKEKEEIISGRYMSKTVDITVSANDEQVAGFGVKFVMSNYAQNSNNYFESMLGETANLRAANKPYFQIFIIPQKLPYFDKFGKIVKWEIITNHNLAKYAALSKDNTDIFFHTPVKTFLCILEFPKCDERKIINKKTFEKFYLNLGEEMPIQYYAPNLQFGNAIILNDYNQFANKATHYIKSL